jgi:hypothetical protein
VPLFPFVCAEKVGILEAKHFACSLLPEDFPCRWSVPRTTQVAYYLLSAHKKMFAKFLAEVSSLYHLCYSL